MPDGGTLGLGRLGDHLDSYAAGVSNDGEVIVGFSGTGPDHAPSPVDEVPGDQAFLWTETDAMVGLGFLPDHGWSRATAVSGDGRVVVGSSAAVTVGGDLAEVGVHEAFIWDADHGMRSLKDLLADRYGLDMPDWPLGEPTGIPADGRVIVGNGGGAWLAVIPEPSNAVLAVSALLGLLLLARRRRRIA